MFGAWGNSALASFDDPLAKEREPPAKPLPIQLPAYSPELKFERLSKRKHAELKNFFLKIKKPDDITTAHVQIFNVKYRANVPFADLVPELPDGLIEEGVFNAIVKDEFAFENDPCYRKITRLQPVNGEKLPRLQQAFIFYQKLEEMSRYWDNSKDNYFERTAEAKASVTRSTNRRESLLNLKPSSNSIGDIQMTEAPNGDSASEQKPAPLIEKLYTGRRSGNAANMPGYIRDGLLEGFLRTATHKFNAQAKVPEIKQQAYHKLQIGEILIPVRHTCVVRRGPVNREEVKKLISRGPLIVGSSREEVVFRKDGEEQGQGQAEVADFLRELGGLLLLAQQRNREGKKEVLRGSDESCWWAKMPRWGGGKGGKMPHEETEESEDFSKVRHDDVKDLPNGHSRTRSDDILKDADQLEGSIPDPVNNIPKPLLTKTHTMRAPATIWPPDATTGATSAPSAAAADSLDVAMAAFSSISNTVGSSEAPDVRTSVSVSIRNDLESFRGGRSTRSFKRRRPNLGNEIGEKWKLLQPPAPLWDPTLIPMAIGKVDGIDGEWDDVFMVSTVNTHISILRMRISRGYLEWLENGSMSEIPTEKQWGKSGIVLPKDEPDWMDWEGKKLEREVIYIERTKWWDVFVPAERVEALGALWRVLSWLCREVGGGKLPWQVE